MRTVPKQAIPGPFNFVLETFFSIGYGFLEPLREINFRFVPASV